MSMNTYTRYLRAFGVTATVVAFVLLEALNSPVFVGIAPPR